MTHLLVGAALLVVPLAVVPLVVYLARHVELGTDEELPAPGRGYVTYGTASGEPAHDERGGCPHCGTAVRGEYDYCGECAGRLRGVRDR